MPSLCIKTIHTLLTLPHFYQIQHHHCRSISSFSLGLQSILDDSNFQSANVLHSVSIKRGDIMVGVSVDEMLNSSAGSVMDAMSCCTESLGFESSDQLEDQIVPVEEKQDFRSVSRARANLVCRRRMAENICDVRTEEAKRNVFPKPLSSLNRNRFVKSRTEGRLEIRVIRMEQPEFLRASRENGRLTLCLIKPEPVQEQQDRVQESTSESAGTSVVEVVEPVENLIKPEEVLIKQEEINRESIQRRNYEISRRCYDISYHHRHREVPLWRSHCVMSG